MNTNLLAALFLSLILAVPGSAGVGTTGAAGGSARTPLFATPTIGQMRALQTMLQTAMPGGHGDKIKRLVGVNPIENPKDVQLFAPLQAVYKEGMTAEQLLAKANQLILTRELESAARGHLDGSMLDRSIAEMRQLEEFIAFYNPAHLAAHREVRRKLLDKKLARELGKNERAFDMLEAAFEDGKSKDDALFPAAADADAMARFMKNNPGLKPFEASLREAKLRPGDNVQVYRVRTEIKKFFDHKDARNLAAVGAAFAALKLLAGAPLLMAAHTMILISIYAVLYPQRAKPWRDVGIYAATLAALIGAMAATAPGYEGNTALAALLGYFGARFVAREK